MISINSGIFTGLKTKKVHHATFRSSESAKSSGVKWRISVCLAAQNTQHVSKFCGFGPRTAHHGRNVLCHLDVCLRQKINSIIAIAGTRRLFHLPIAIILFFSGLICVCFWGCSFVIGFETRKKKYRTSSSSCIINWYTEVLHSYNFVCKCTGVQTIRG